MDIQKTAKEIDGVYRNLLHSFHSDASELVNSAKKYLTALHGSSAAGGIFLESFQKLHRSSSRVIEDKTCLANNDKTMQLLHQHQVEKKEHLKTLYTSFILPLEQNLSRDQSLLLAHHKTFQIKCKTNLQIYKKALNNLKKIKKSNYFSNKRNLDKEIAGRGFYEEEKDKIERFFSEAKVEVMGMAGRRYGWVFGGVSRSVLGSGGGGGGCSGGGCSISMDEDNGTLCGSDDDGTISGGEVEAAIVAPDFPPPPPPPMQITTKNATADKVVKKRALYPHGQNSGDDDDDGYNNLLHFKENDFIEVFNEENSNNNGWKHGRNINSGRCGWFPESYLEEDSVVSLPPPPPPPPLPMSAPPSLQQNKIAMPPPQPPQVQKISAVVTQPPPPQQIYSKIKSKSLIQLPEIDYSSGDDDDEDYDYDDECFYNNNGSSASFGNTISRINNNNGILTIVPTKPASSGGTMMMSRSSSFNCSPSNSDDSNSNSGIRSFIKRTMSFMGNNNNNNSTLSLPRNSKQKSSTTTTINSLRKREVEEKSLWLDSINLRRLFGASFKSEYSNKKRRRSVVTGGVWNDLWDNSEDLNNNCNSRASTIGRAR